MNIGRKRKVMLHKEVDELLEKKNFEKARDLISTYKLIGYQVCQLGLHKMFYYGLKAQREINLTYNEVDNPYYSKAAPMKLFLIAEAENFLKRRPEQ